MRNGLCGLTGVNGQRVLNGWPEMLKATCEQSLRKLKTEVLDIYYLHRRDRSVPVEDSVGALALAWLLKKSPNLHVLPGTTSSEHVEENFAALEVTLSDNLIASLEDLINRETISGPRYQPVTPAKIDTEEYATTDARQ